jgi:UDP-glucose 4-epimerase
VADVGTLRVTNMRVLITGGTGRIARALAPHLRSLGYLVFVTIRPGSSGTVDDVAGCTALHLDCLQSPESFGEHVQEGDTVIHLACSSDPAASQADPAADIEINLMGTLGLLRQSVAKGAKRFVFASSGGTVYGKSSGSDAIREDAPLEPISMHGAMKAASELYLRSAASSSDILLQILRISNPYGLATGSRRQGFIDVAIEALKRGDTIKIWGNGSVVRDYIYITDLLTAFECVLHNDRSFTLNVGSGVGASINDIVELLATHFDLTNRTDRLPGRPIDVPRNVLDVSAARSVLGWRPVVDLPEGIRRVVAR